MLARLPLESLYPEGGRLMRDGTRFSSGRTAGGSAAAAVAISVGGWRVADSAVAPVIRAAETFSFTWRRSTFARTAVFHDIAMTSC
jgi:hypothetical protein